MGAGRSQVLQQLIRVGEREWLACDDNAAHRSCHENPFTAKERQVLVMWWEGQG